MSINAQRKENQWEDDPGWELLDKSDTAKPAPLFVADVMRKVRLNCEEKRQWWRLPALARPILAASTATIIAILIISFNQDAATTTKAHADPTHLPGEMNAPKLDTLLDEEILSQAAEDPTAFSDEALIALLSQ